MLYFSFLNQALWLIPAYIQLPHSISAYTRFHADTQYKITSTYWQMAQGNEGCPITKQYAGGWCAVGADGARGDVSTQGNVRCLVAEMVQCVLVVVPRPKVTIGSLWPRWCRWYVCLIIFGAVDEIWIAPKVTTGALWYQNNLQNIHCHSIYTHWWIHFSVARSFTTVTRLSDLVCNNHFSDSNQSCTSQISHFPLSLRQYTALDTCPIRYLQYFEWTQ